MKVQNINRSEQGHMSQRAADSRETGEGRALVFQKTLTNLSQEHYREHLMELKKGIDRQGEKLAGRVDVKEFEKYRQLIREFLDEIVSNGYNFTRENAYASRGRHRFIATVKVIDEKLDELGKEVMKEQADKIEVLGRIDDIRGLLLDMML